MSRDSESSKKNLSETAGASVAANAATLDAPIGMKEPKQQLSQKTNDYIKQNERESKKLKVLSFKEWTSGTSTD